MPAADRGQRCCRTGPGSRPRPRCTSRWPSYATSPAPPKPRPPGGQPPRRAAWLAVRPGRRRRRLRCHHRADRDRACGPGRAGPAGRGVPGRSRPQRPARMGPSGSRATAAGKAGRAGAGAVGAPAQPARHCHPRRWRGCATPCWPWPPTSCPAPAGWHRGCGSRSWPAAPPRQPACRWMCRCRSTPGRPSLPSRPTCAAPRPPATRTAPSPAATSPSSVCQIHHLIPRSQGGPTALHNLVPLCAFHHLIVIHRWGWTLRLKPDGTTTATSPDGRTLHSHGPPSPPQPTRPARRSTRPSRVKRGPGRPAA